ncbi:DUF1629 domain-containing protein [Paenibacillus sp. FSL W8-0919]|uniref:imm11 family protein n=1 Tax=Paenibacillus sp. FSL W8-0919 TaxID=2954707 RepID=UPI0030F801F3
MDYFILERDVLYTDRIRPVWDGEPPELGQLGTAAPANLQPQPEILQLRVMDGEYPDYLETPVPLISKRFKPVFDAAAPGVLSLPAVLRNPAHMRQDLYWMIQAPAIDAVDRRSEFHKDGSLSRLIIDGERTGDYHVFRLTGIREPLIIVSLAMAESLLRRLCSGVRLRPVEIR